MLVGGDRYTLRLRLGRGLPCEVARTADEGEARRLVEALRARGVGAVASSLADAEPWRPAGRCELRLDVGPDGRAETVLLPEGLRLPSGAVRVVVLAAIDHERTREEIEHVVVARNARTGPVTAPVSRYREDARKVRVLYLFTGPRRRAVRLAEGELSLSGLAPSQAQTARARFDAALAALRGALDAAVFDQTLVDRRRARSQMAVRADGRERLTTNARETDLAARLLALALFEGQAG